MLLSTHTVTLVVKLTSRTFALSRGKLCAREPAFNPRQGVQFFDDTGPSFILVDT